MSQKSDILNHLLSGKKITQLDSWILYRCFNLRNRISELRREYYITGVSVTIGKKTFQRYSMEWSYE